ncbi:TPA: helix-turn-helix transcriptional regulator [Morganella morganii]|nr:helix-turn-helix transcriptional regulator [Morganella morganii]HCR3762765.1 helix-turn-helix transcriptional regulator [Morganella morganii]HCT5325085.1 helix-turn-helix transcriptional regulator [Morganella morganii]HEI8513869.1 helix-turn-helix transcriptional regulator [Morganella morganii]
MPRRNQELNTYVGQRIKALRNSLGMSESQLAQLIDTTTKKITNYESGLESIPVHALFIISHVFNVSVTELLPDFAIYSLKKQ